MPSSPYAISLSEASREELESLSRRGTAPYQMVMRVRIVLLAAGGTANCAIAGRLGICEDTARKWRRRYWEQGLDGLADAPRPGRPSSILIDTGTSLPPGRGATGAKMGANGSKPHQTTADPFRTFLLVRGSPFDSIRPKSTAQICVDTEEVTGSIPVSPTSLVRNPIRGRCWLRPVWRIIRFAAR